MEAGGIYKYEVHCGNYLMPVSSLFRYHFCKRVFDATATPWSTPWQVSALLIEASAIEAVYDDDWEAFAKADITNGWSIQEYVEISDTLPYAYLTTDPSWENETAAEIIVQTICISAYNTDTELRDVLIWQECDSPCSVPAGDTFEVEDFKFQLVTLDEL